MTQISQGPEHRVNAMCSPSGDHVGSEALDVSMTWFALPSSMTQTWPSRVKAILLRSGDHAGDDSNAALLVRFVGWLPFESVTKMSSLPGRSERNAISEPSGGGPW
jgi:hypothetical protein